LRWDDVDLNATPATLTVAGTVVIVMGDAEKDTSDDDGPRGAFRQDMPKSSAGFRELSLPRFATAMLLRRQVNATPNPENLIFPSGTGTVRSPHNLNRIRRDAFGPEFAWVTWRTFRKTVATLVDRERTPMAAAKQLGHSNEDVTLKHYIDRAAQAPDLTTVLEQLGESEEFSV
jgi:integrase